MTFTLEKLRDSIAGVLKRIIRMFPVYGIRTSRETKRPVFCVL